MTVSVTTVTDRSFSGTSVTERTLSESEEELSVTEGSQEEEEEEGSNWDSEGWGLHEGFLAATACCASGTVSLSNEEKLTNVKSYMPREWGRDDAKTWTKRGWGEQKNVCDQIIRAQNWDYHEDGLLDIFVVF